MAQGRALTNPTLESIRDEWRSLLVRSSADPLFNSPEWLEAWWGQYGPMLGATLDIRRVPGGQGIVALGLFSRRRVRHRGRLSGERLELLGTARGASGVAFSERTEWLLDSAHEGEASAALLQSFLDDPSWVELLVSYTPENSPTHALFLRLAQASGAYLRTADYMEAWELPLAGGFEALLAAMGAGTRQRIVGSRTRLEKAGDLRERLLGVAEVELGMELFARLHFERWQRPFNEHWRRFYGAIAVSQAARGVPVISVLEFDGEPISVLVNFRAGRREYSIGAAFTPVAVKRVSPGWLHLGMAIERACADGMEVFDFLGGEGKNEQYKAAFGGRSERLLCLQLLRATRLKWLYRAWDRTQRIRARRVGGSS